MIWSLDAEIEESSESNAKDKERYMIASASI